MIKYIRVRIRVHIGVRVYTCLSLGSSIWLISFNTQNNVKDVFRKRTSHRTIDAHRVDWVAKWTDECLTTRCLKDCSAHKLQAMNFFCQQVRVWKLFRLVTTHTPSAYYRWQAVSMFPLVLTGCGCASVCDVGGTFIEEDMLVVMAGT